MIRLLIARYQGFLYGRALLLFDPMFDPLRNDPRFQKLCEEEQN